MSEEEEMNTGLGNEIIVNPFQHFGLIDCPVPVFLFGIR
jgi:hypothetical protein